MTRRDEALDASDVLSREGEAKLRDVAAVLRTTREREAKDRYINRLRARASITDTAEMTARLLTIAEARFYPPGMPEPAGPRRTPTPPGR